MIQKSSCAVYSMMHLANSVVYMVSIMSHCRLFVARLDSLTKLCCNSPAIILAKFMPIQSMLFCLLHLEEH